MRAMLKAALMAAALSLGPVASMAAGPIDDAAAAYQRRDYAAALRLYRPLAEQGVAAAQYSLGVMYYTGQGVPRNFVEASKWYRLAAAQGDAGAMTRLGVMSIGGQGVAPSPAEAMKWYQRAADRGFATAQYELGMMYFDNPGVAQDFVQAHLWLSLAEARGHKEAGLWRDKVAAKMKPAQLAEARRLARAWKAKPAN